MKVTCPHCGECIEIDDVVNITTIDVINTTYQPVFDGEGLIVPPIVP